MKPSQKLDYGKIMEERACVFLCEAGSRIRVIERNYRWKGGELDIICEEKRADGNIELVFVEVRARGSCSWTTGLESVTRQKQLRIARTIQRYLARYRGRAKSVRVDIMAWDGVRWSHHRDIRIAGGA